jgi:hypothetical protein
MNYAYEYNIILLYLFIHTTHPLQLLNIAIFNSLAIYYSELVKKYSRYKEKDISKRE